MCGMEMMMNIMVFLLCMLAHQPLVAAIASSRYDLTSRKWNVASLTTVRIDLQEYYLIMNNGRHDIVSPNGNFTLGMLPQDSTTSRYLYVCYMMQKKLDGGFAAVVLLGKLAYPTLIFADDGKIELYSLPYVDGIGPEMWNSVEIYDDGTIVFFDAANKVVNDVQDENFLLPGSQLKSGMSLRNSAFPWLYYVHFILEVTDGGFIMRTGGSTVYQALSVDTGREAKEDIVRRSGCKGFKTVLHYNGTDLYLSYERTPSTGLASNYSCHVPPFWIWKSKSQNLLLPFLRLERDGNLVSYAYNQQLGNWAGEFKMIPTDTTTISCKTPACDYGYFCDAKARECVRYESLGHLCDYNTMCNVVENTTLFGVGFYSQRFLTPNMNGKFEDCKHSCTRSCSCSALFYNNHTEDCFFVLDCVYLGALVKDDSTQNITAFIKLKVNNNKRHDTVDSRLILRVIVMTAGLAPILLFPAAICCLAIVKHRKHKSFPEKEIELMLATMPGLPQRYSYTALDRATKGFSTRLGAGGFGSVYEGFTADGKHVAVKKLEHCTDTAGSRQFVTELAGTGGISHLNIVKLCGFCIEGATQRLLIYEFMRNGSLDRWLFGSERSLTWKQRASIALGTAKGLAYLHEECSEPILHLDVKPQNILLDENFVVKVADFGMAKLLANRDVTQVQTGVRGTPGYLAPEWLLRNVATKKCDVYSYGMVLLELIGGRRNIDFTKVNDEEVDPSWYFPAWAVNEVKQGNLLGVVDEKVKVREDVSSDNNELYKEMVKMVYVALWCIQDNPSARPSMHAIVEILEGHAAVEEPPYSFHFDVQTEAIVNSTTPKAAIPSSTLEILDLEDESSLLR